METPVFRLLRIQEVITITGLSKASIYAKGNAKDAARFDPDFPARVQIGRNAVAWPSDGLQAWIEKRMAASTTQHQQGAAS